VKLRTNQTFFIQRPKWNQTPHSSGRSTKNYR